MGNNRNVRYFTQTLIDVEHIYRAIAGFDRSYDELEDPHKEVRKDAASTYLMFDILQKRSEGKNAFALENYFFEGILETTTFQNFWVTVFFKLVIK